MSRRKANGAIYESALEKAVWEWIRWHKLDKYCLKIPNEGRRTSGEGARLKAQGLTPGAVDFFTFYAAHGFPGAFIEFKTKGGKLKDNQRDFLSVAHSQGFFTGVIWTVDASIEFLSWWFEVN